MKSQVTLAIYIGLVCSPLAAQTGGALPGNIPGVPPGAMKPKTAAKIPQVELSGESARSAIDAYFEMREMYGDKAPVVKPRGTGAKAFATLDGVTSILTKHGYSDTQAWYDTIVSVAMAYGFSRNKGGNIEKSIAEMKNNANIPAAMKEKMLAMMQDIRPSENNVNVIKSLLSDPAYGEKIRHITD